MRSSAFDYSIKIFAGKTTCSHLNFTAHAFLGNCTNLDHKAKNQFNYLIFACLYTYENTEEITRFNSNNSTPRKCKTAILLPMDLISFRDISENLFYKIVKMER